MNAGKTKFDQNITELRQSGPTISKVSGSRRSSATISPQYPDTVVVEQPCPIITDSHFVPGPDPVNTVCPYCHKDVTTLVTYKTGILTWAGCFGIFIIGGIFGCCLIPFCCDSCKDADHRCPVCNRDLGLYRRC